MKLLQWILASTPILADALLLTELKDYRGIIEETLPLGTKYTFKPIPRLRLRREKVQQPVEPTITALVNFSVQQ